MPASSSSRAERSLHRLAQSRSRGSTGDAQGGESSCVYGPPGGDLTPDGEHSELSPRVLTQERHARRAARREPVVLHGEPRKRAQRTRSMPRRRRRALRFPQRGTSGEGRNATEHSVPSSKLMARSAVRASVHAAVAVSPSAFPEGTRSGPYAPTLPSSPKVPARVPPHYFRCGVLALLSPRGTFAV